MELVKDFLVTFMQLFLSAVIPPLAAVAAGYLIAWAKKKLAQATAELDETTLWAIKQAATSAVLAAEQTGLGKSAIEKKDFAIATATEWLESKGIKFDLATLDTLIEAAVMTEFNQEAVIESKSVL